MRKAVASTEAQAVNIQGFLKIVKKYTEPTELTPALLREFVEKVVVHAPNISSGSWKKTKQGEQLTMGNF